MGVVGRKGSVDGAADIERKMSDVGLYDRRASRGSDVDLSTVVCADVLRSEAEEVVVPLVGKLLADLVATNNALLAEGHKEPRTTVFHALEDPKIDVSFYVTRIKKYSGASPACFLVSLILLDRALQKMPGFLLTSFNVHRVYLTCILVASKYWDDLYYSNAHWSKVGGVNVRELNALELELIFLLDWKIGVRPAEYASYRAALLDTGSSMASTPIGSSKPTSSSGVLFTNP
mmetsp:Transcript_8582/g.19757  ORF Transcript_8582/g.19757 Transcript_8582/m.19757 type:complete len:232 (-) Transcript_8582:238-933(-)|eukprot:CAMPEP_0114557360 /NCGR_PEP_ID=MMETSP0114-20121206/9789_1 /TAXON_ID=31324 /ORGANISM="Goniomonas sp, Strain m" /LENGTH=231 /DNA_ID=CAMNT_0001742643 /DNA_START=48 /DNA_END=743 /DNA_ORIENTATION=-